MRSWNLGTRSGRATRVAMKPSTLIAKRLPVTARSIQGVFGSGHEIGRVTGHWRDQIDDAYYDMSITETAEDGTGAADDLADEDADRLLRDAVEVIREYDRASASLLQRRLKVGYARAARMIDQLEARGYIGAFDGSNARVVLRRESAGRDAGRDGGDD